MIRFAKHTLGVPRVTLPQDIRVLILIPEIHSFQKKGYKSDQKSTRTGRVEPRKNFMPFGHEISDMPGSLPGAIESFAY